MYTKEPNWFEEPDPQEEEKQIDRSFPDYDDTNLDWDYLIRLEKKHTFFDNIHNLLTRYNFKYRYFPLEKRYRIWFTDQSHFNKFKLIYNKGKLLQNLKPWKNEFKLNSSGCMDYKINNI